MLMMIIWTLWRSYIMNNLINLFLPKISMEGIDEQKKFKENN